MADDRSRREFVKTAITAASGAGLANVAIPYPVSGGPAPVVAHPSSAPAPKDPMLSLEKGLVERMLPNNLSYADCSDRRKDEGVLLTAARPRSQFSRTRTVTCVIRSSQDCETIRRRSTFGANLIRSVPFFGRHHQGFPVHCTVNQRS
jgi:hypothetical protein